MHFSLHSLAEEQPDRTCYFRMHSDHEPVYSPFYSNRKAALEGMEKLVLTLRKAMRNSKLRPKARGNRYTIKLFGNESPAVGLGVNLKDVADAEQTREDWQAAALATSFRVLHYELVAEEESLETLKGLDFTETDTQYVWKETSSSLLYLAQKEKKKLPANAGVQLGVDSGPCAPVFSALQPFVNTGFPLFHGRNKETEEVHALLKNRPLLLLYGAPRVGKTSLLQCGLANRLEEGEEELIVINKQTGIDILEALSQALGKKLGLALADYEGQDPSRLARQLQAQEGKRLFLVFDQLEQVFSAEIYDAERASLFRFVRELTVGEATPFRVILSMREAFLAPMVDYEHELPELLDTRFRLLPLQQGSMINATANLLDVLKLGNKIDTDDPRAFAQKACQRLTNERGEVPADCLQIYLHQLHQGSCQETETGPVPMTPELVDRMGPAPELIDRFYQEKLTALRSQLPGKGAPPNPVLERQIEELEAGRQKCGCGDKKVAAAGAAVVPVPVGGFGWWGWLALAALPFLFFFLWWWFFGAGEQQRSACSLAAEEDTCVAYVNYLCEYGDDDEDACAQDFASILEERNCDLWRDYQSLRQLPTCGTYEDFFNKYRNEGICMDLVQEKLLDWSCPLVRDTVQLTVRDTVVREVPGPGTYGNRLNGRPANPANAPCKQIGPNTLKKVGPLWIMTETISGGPYGWEDALDACAIRGYRLPCIGEIDFLIEKIYRDDPGRAFDMLSGNGECFLVNPGENPGGRIEFWTATEANDAAAWSYYFDMPSRTIGRQSATPKSARLPCLCVEKDTDRSGSGIPPCYQKQVDRVPGK